MSKATFDIRIGKPQDLVQKQVFLFNVQAFLNKWQIQQFKQKMTTKLSVQKLPLIIFEIPTHPSQIPKDKVPLMNRFLQPDEDKKQLNCTIKKIDTYQYYMSHAFSQQDEILNTINKIEKIFSKLNTLQNKFFIEAKFFDIVEKRKQLQKGQQPYHYLSVLFDQAIIQGVVDVDGQFYNLFCDLVRKISPKFAQSPITALAPLFQQFDFQLELQSINDLKPQVRQKILIANSNHFDEDLMKITDKVQDNINIYICLNELGYIRVTYSPRLLPYMNMLN